MAVWNPLLQQSAESDTTFMPDFTSQPTINAGGGFLQGDNVAQTTLAARYDFGTGKFGPAVRPKVGQAQMVFYPVDGLIDGDEFTFEYWQRIDGLWSDFNSGKALMAIQSSQDGNYLKLFSIFNGTASCSMGAYDGISSVRIAQSVGLTVSTLGLNNNVFNSFAVTFKRSTGVLKIYVNGVEKGQITGLTGLIPIWADMTKEEGIQIGGEPANNNGVWTSDVRASATLRVPGVDPAPLRSLTGSLAINATSTSGSVPSAYGSGLKLGRFGTVYGPDGLFTNTDAQESLSSLREADTITSTPIKAGAPDGTHPLAGQSGSFSYDPALWDKSLDIWDDGNIEIFVGADSCPQILGGHIAPDTSLYHIGTKFSDRLPNNFASFGTIFADLIDYANDTGRHITWLGDWNEPDQYFWAGFGGTIDQKIDLQKAVSAAVKAVDSTVKVGFGATSTILTNWMDRTFQRKVAEGFAMDFYEIHDYSGSLVQLDRMKANVVHYAGVRSLTPVPPIVVGEFNWADVNDESGYARFRGGFWHVRSLVAAYTTAYLIRGLELGGFDQMNWSHTCGVYGPIRDPAAAHFGTMQLVGNNHEHWAPFNAMKGWKMTMHNRAKLSVTKTLPPGVYAFAAKDTGNNKYGIALANYGWANRTSRTVNVTFTNLPAGDYRLKRHLVDEAHSRWDQVEDAPAGDAFDQLHVAENRVDTAANLSSFSVSLPRHSSTFITIEPEGGGGDVTDPETTIDSGPSDGPATTVQFEFSSNEPGSTFEGRMDSGAWTTMLSPKQYTGMAPGMHHFEVRAIDPSGNVDDTPDMFMWTVTITGGDSAYDNEVDTDAPRHHWKLNDQSGTVAVDRKGAKNGTYEGGVTLQAAGKLADGDDAAHFNGTDDRVMIPNFGAIGTNFTVEGWFKTSATGTVFSAYAPLGSAVIKLQVNPRVFAHVTSDTGNNLFLDGSFGLDNNAWHHIALVKDGSTWRLYENHVQVTTGAHPAGGLTVTEATIGSRKDQEWFIGDLDEIAVYDSALSATRLEAHHVVADEGSPPPDVTPPDTTITQAPADGPATAVTFHFQANEPSTFQGRLDGGSWTTITSPHTISGLAATSHTFEIRATDLASNVDPSPASHTWVVQPGGTTQVTDEWLWITDDRIGAQMNQPGVDQGPELQTGVNLAKSGDGVLHLPPGIIENRSAELTWVQSDGAIHIVGSGAGDNETSGTTIHYPVDFGLNKFPMFNSLVGIAYPWIMRDLHIKGPSTRIGMGQDVSDMWGPKIYGRNDWDNVHISGFKTGVVLQADHHDFRRCRFGGNSFGIYLGLNQGHGGGDFLFESCDTTGCKKASIAIGTTHALQGFMFIKGHSGFSPIGCYRFEEAQVQRKTNFLEFGEFIAHAFEACGECVIFDEPGDGVISNVTFPEIGQAIEPLFNWKGYQDALWDVGGVEDVTVTGDVSPWVIPGQDRPWIWAGFVKTLRCLRAKYAGDTMYHADIVHSLIRASFMENVYIGPDHPTPGHGNAATVVNAAESIGRFDAVEITESGTARRARNTNPYLGQAIAPSLNGSVYVNTNGYETTWVRAKVSRTTKAGDRLIVDPGNPGFLRPGGEGSNYLCRAVADITSGQSGPVKIMRGGGR